MNDGHTHWTFDYFGWIYWSDVAWWLVPGFCASVMCLICLLMKFFFYVTKY